MHTRPLIGGLMFWLGCSEYDFKSTKETAPGMDTAAETVEEPDLEPDPEPEEDTEEPTTEDEPSDPEVPTEDEDSGDPCTEVVTAFDIEEVSTLQDAASPYLVTDPRLLGFAEPWHRDALVLTYAIPADEPDTSWRVSAVEVLVMIATERFETHPDGGMLGIEVFDGSDPRTAPTWTATQTVNKAELTWTSYTLPFDAAISGPLSEYHQQGTWLRFDLTDVVPETGMTSAEFVVGVQWEELSQVAVGYSNFNRACDRNWTEWAPYSGWRLNGDATSGSQCSWPMMRVEIERIYTDDCD